MGREASIGKGGQTEEHPQGDPDYIRTWEQWLWTIARESETIETETRVMMSCTYNSDVESPRDRMVQRLHSLRNRKGKKKIPGRNVVTVVVIEKRIVEVAVVESAG